MLAVYNFQAFLHATCQKRSGGDLFAPYLYLNCRESNFVCSTMQHSDTGDTLLGMADLAIDVTEPTKMESSSTADNHVPTTPARKNVAYRSVSEYKMRKTDTILTEKHPISDDRCCSKGWWRPRTACGW